jgi:hypothetical protein
MKITYILFLLPLLLSSCIEIIDDLSIHSDGTGTFKYSINLSSSKLKVNSILSLDSLDGKKVPDLAEIEAKITEFKNLLSQEPGISMVKTDFNTSDFILKISIDFNSISQLQSGIKSVLIRLSKDKDQNAIEEDWISWDGKTLNREIPSAVTSKVKSFEYSEIDLLKSGTYTSITRFDKPILKTSNSNCKLNPSRTASMLQVNTFDLKLNNSLIENAITLTP